MIKIMLRKSVLFNFLLFASAMATTEFKNSAIDSFISSKMDFNSSNYISILGLVNFNGRFSSGPICTKALELGLEQIEAKGLLQDLELRIELKNSNCNDSISIKETVEDLKKSHDGANRLPIMILDECSSFGNVIGAKLLKQHDFIGLSTNLKTADKDLAKQLTTFGFLPELAFSPTVWLEYMLMNDWKKFAVFSDNREYFNQIEVIMHKIYGEQDRELAVITKIESITTDLFGQIEMAVRTIESTGARIIISHTDYVIPLTCWQHRLGMMRNYVFLGTGWSMYNPDTVKIPDEISKWCTRSMLKEALKSWIWLDMGWMRDIFGDSYQDSTGLTQDRFTQLMRQKVMDADQQRPWRTWAPRCYDLGLYTGSLIANIEARLKMLNSSLLDWTIDGKNFKRNSSFIQNLMLETVFDHSIEGQQFSISIDRQTRRNSKGWPSILLKQILPSKNDDGYSHVNVAFFKYNDKAFVNIGNKRVQWATDDGKPPADRIERIEIRSESTSLGSYIGFTVISSFLVVGSLISLVEYLLRRKSRYKKYKFSPILLISLMILLAHSFAFPFKPGQPAILICDISFAFFTIGLSLTFSSIVAITSNKQQTTFSKFGQVKILILSFIQLVLVAVLLSLQTISSKTIVEQKQLSTDGKQEISIVKEICFIDLSKSNAIGMLLIAIGIILVLQLLSMSFRAYTIKRAFKLKKASKVNNRAATCSYVVALITLATVLIVIINPVLDNISTMSRLLSILISILSFGLIEIPRIRNPEDDIIKSKTKSRYFQQ